MGRSLVSSLSWYAWSFFMPLSGFHSIYSPGRGNMYLTTRGASPFCGLFRDSMAHLRQLFSIPRLSLSDWAWTWPRYDQNRWGDFCGRSFQLRNVGQCQCDDEVITRTESRPSSRTAMNDSSLDPMQKSKAVMSFVISSAIELWSVKSIMLLSISTRQRAVSIHRSYP